jgi:hypothetical protein
MKIEVKRYSSSEESTLGLLFIDGIFQCYTIEDQYQEVKVKSETRIPEGSYKIVLRQEGGMTEKYAKRFPEIHKGMLWVTNVPGFEYILIHMGNSEKDSAGCLLVVDSIVNNKLNEGGGALSQSAYLRVYKKALVALEAREPVTISYTNIEQL